MKNLISQKDIVKVLRVNTCPHCARHFMAAERHEDGRYFVTCNFCFDQWEITADTFNDHVRIMDTKTYKMEHGWK